MLNEIHDYSKLSTGQPQPNKIEITNKIASNYGIDPQDADRATDIIDANTLMRAFLKTMSGDSKVFKISFLSFGFFVEIF